MTCSVLTPFPFIPVLAFLTLIGLVSWALIGLINIDSDYNGRWGHEDWKKKYKGIRKHVFLLYMSGPFGYIFYAIYLWPLCYLRDKIKEWLDERD